MCFKTSYLSSPVRSSSHLYFSLISAPLTPPLCHFLLQSSRLSALQEQVLVPHSIQFMKEVQVVLTEQMLLSPEKR